MWETRRHPFKKGFEQEQDKPLREITNEEFIEWHSLPLPQLLFLCFSWWEFSLGVIDCISFISRSRGDVKCKGLNRVGTKMQKCKWNTIIGNLDAGPEFSRETQSKGTKILNFDCDLSLSLSLFVEKKIERQKTDLHQRKDWKRSSQAGNDVSNHDHFTEHDFHSKKRDKNVFSLLFSHSLWDLCGVC
jgi:hypothetical protein